jgi:hypothetical protein
MPVSRAITAAAVVLLALVAPEVDAQESVTVRASETRALASASQPITVTSPATKGATWGPKKIAAGGIIDLTLPL